jgi:hypothetical protein
MCAAGYHCYRGRRCCPRPAPGGVVSTPSMPLVYAMQQQAGCCVYNPTAQQLLGQTMTVGWSTSSLVTSLALSHALIMPALLLLCRHVLRSLPPSQRGGPHHPPGTARVAAAPAGAAPRRAPRGRRCAGAERGRPDGGHTAQHAHAGRGARALPEHSSRHHGNVTSTHPFDLPTSTQLQHARQALEHALGLPFVIAVTPTLSTVPWCVRRCMAAGCATCLTR